MSPAPGRADLEPYGFWDGLTETERDEILRRRRVGARLRLAPTVTGPVASELGIRPPAATTAAGPHD